MPGYRQFELVNVETGMKLYSTCATFDEVTAANDNLRKRTLNYRFYLAGTYHAPALHDPK